MIVISRWLVTAALPYVNNVPHIGIVSTTHLPGDIFVRFLRLFEEEVVYIGGTDEHGSSTEIAAFKEKISPQALTDRIYVIHKLTTEWLGVKYDNFSRTSKQINHEITQQIFIKLLNNGYISKKKLLLPYCNIDRRFLPDRWIEGTCPHCGYRPARGDQCADSCGRLLDPHDLKQPYCIICKNPPVFKEVEHLFLDLDKFKDRLKKWIISNKHWKKNVRYTALGWIKEGLKPRCISRDLQWGVRIPLDGFKDKVFFVWFDALIGYISSTVEWSQKIGKPEEWKRYWQDKNTKIIHFIGKDNIPLHSIFWPAMLLGTKDFNLPYQIAGFEFLKYEGQKISKSRNWGIFLELIDNQVKVRVGEKLLDINPDFLRFYLTLIIPENKDSDFRWKEFERKINSELIGNFGNFVYRVLSFIKMNFNFTIPEPGKLGVKEKNLIKKITKTKKAVKEDILNLKFRNALKEILALSKAGNKYFQEKKPWETRLKKPEDCRNTLYVSINLVKALAVLLGPFIPFSTERLWRQLNLSSSVHSQAFDDLDKLEIQAGHRLGQIEPLFKKFELKI